MDEIKKAVDFLSLIGFKEVRVKNFECEKVDPSVEELEKLKEEVLKCCKCKLCENRTNVVFGEGNFKTPLMLIGEAPGEQEDIQGRPFVGRAGQLLTKYLSLCGVSRSSVFITNIVKCRPPNNRNPEVEEIRTCFPYLERQIKFISPKVTLCLGAISTRTILNLPENASISRLRGKQRKVKILETEVVVVPTFHPAFLLRNRRYETEFQKDLELAIELAGL